MKSKYYFGIGSDEYSYWKTIDNGKTWDYLSEAGGKKYKVPNIDSYTGITTEGETPGSYPGTPDFIEDSKFVTTKTGRIIKSGIKISDDNGETWIEGNPLIGGEVIGKITEIEKDSQTGEEKEVEYVYTKIESKNKNVIPHNEDDEPKSNNKKFDKNYENIKDDLPEEGIYKSVDGETWIWVGSGTGNKVEVSEDGKTVKVSGEKDTLIIDNGKKKFIDNEMETFDFSTSSSISELIDDLLLYILNNIIIPKLSFMLAEQNHIYNIEYDSFSGHDTYFTNFEIFKVNPKMIDFFADVGMKPLSIKDIKEFKDNEKISDDIYKELTDNDKKEKRIENMLNYNKALKNTYHIMDLQINNTKDYVQKYELGEITNLPEDYTGLNSPQDIAAMKQYYDTAKGSRESIIGTIINGIFTFNNSKKMNLLRTSIIETAYSLKETIKIKLELIKNKVISGIYTREDIDNCKELQDALKFNLKEEWYNSLKTTIENYYLEAKKNILEMTEFEDKDLISIAADNYKDYKVELLDNATDTIDKIEQHENLSIETLNKLVNKTIDDTYAKIKEIVKANKDIENNLHKLLEEFKKNEEKYNKEIIASIDNIKNEFAGTFLDRLNKNIDYYNYNFDEDDNEEVLSNLNEEFRLRVYDYYKEIIDEFKNRCVTLYKMVSDQVILFHVNDIINISNDIGIYIADLLNSKDYNKYVNEKNLSYLNNKTKEAFKEFYNLSIADWKGNREMI